MGQYRGLDLMMLDFYMILMKLRFNLLHYPLYGRGVELLPLNYYEYKLIYMRLDSRLMQPNFSDVLTIDTPHTTVRNQSFKCRLNRKK